MHIPQALISLAPITCGLTQRNPHILLGGSHQPTLLRYLDGWPKRWAGPRTFLINFVPDGDSLARFASNQFDMAVIQAPTSAQLEETVRQLTRVAKQGLITRR
jgi:hypothetical protein